ncbi:MAG: ABC transporter permease [Vicinamibacterales bacterium]
MFHDLRRGLHTLLAAKGWTTVVVVCLALGIGANTALFGAVNGLLLRPIPVREPASLVRLRYAGRNDMSTNSSDYGFSGRDAAGRSRRATFSYPMYRRFVEENRTLTDLAAGAPFGRVSLARGGEAEIANAFLASGNFFQLLGVPANPGRVFTPDDDRPDAPPVGVISAGFWRARFGGVPDIIGSVVTVNTVPVTIVGVLAPEFRGNLHATAEPPDITLPLALDARLSPEDTRLTSPTSWWLQVIGRLRPGVTPAQVEGNLGALFQGTARAGLDAFLAGLPDDERNTVRNRGRTEVPQLVVDSAARGIYDATEPDTRAISVLGGVVGLVLLLVCANVANLLLSRAAARHKEMSVRLSLGATRARLVRQLFVESLLLAAAGGALGLVVGRWGQQLLPGALGRPLPIDWALVAFAMAASAVTASLFGIVPALRTTAINVNAALKDGSRGVIGSLSWLSKGLLVAQVAISLVLLVGAGLFLRTVQNLRHVDVGFNPQNLVLFRVSPRLNGYDVERSRRLYQDILDRTAAVGGVRGSAASLPALLSGGVNSLSLYVPGRTYPTPVDIDTVSVHRLIVTPGFFSLMDIPLLLGRDITDGDTDDAPKVVVMNEAAARKFFPGEHPIGKRVGPSIETSGTLEVVGVVRDAKYNSVRDDAPPTIYVSAGQYPMSTPAFVVRTAGDPMSAVGALRQAVHELDPTLPLMNVSTQMEQIEDRIAQEKLFARAYALFGGLALLVAAVGLFGLMSYSVSRRTNEIGVRMALGARPEDVLGLVMGESLRLVALGLAIGTAIALAAGRLVASLLFDVSPMDLSTLGLAVAVLAAVAIVAGFLPARRAASVDPMAALHDQ